MPELLYPLETESYVSNGILMLNKCKLFRQQYASEKDFYAEYYVDAADFVDDLVGRLLMPCYADLWVVANDLRILPSRPKSDGHTMRPANC